MGFRHLVSLQVLPINPAGIMRILATLVIVIGFLAPIAGLPLASKAAARPDIRTMTCAQAQDTILRNGGIVMSTGTHTFERFVANKSFCDPFQEVRPRWYATADNPQCRLNYICEKRIKRFDR